MPSRKRRPKTTWIKRERERLHAIDPKCHWCKVVTILPESGGVIKGRIKKNCATLDHIHPKTSIHYCPKAVVLACHSCNKRRNAEDPQNQKTKFF